MTSPAASSRSDRGRALIASVLIAAALLAAYANSFRGAFVFDDIEAIVENPTIRDLADLGAVLSPPFAEGQTVGGRPVVNLSLALNHAVGGLDPTGYHAVNLAIHLAAALVLFGLVRRTALLGDRSEVGRVIPNPPGFALGDDRGGLGITRPTFATFFAAGVALLWALHPLQTESVTYVIQRAESLMGLFYLLTLYGFVRGVTAERGTGWFVGSFLCCLAGMGTKEVMVSAPVMVLLFDRAFVSGTIAAAWRNRRLYYGGLAATWLLLGALVLSTQNRGGSMGLGVSVSVGEYLLTQGPAILHYLRLTVWPHPQIFDYGAIFPDNALASLPAVGVVAALALGTLWLLWKKPVPGFFAGWFFAVLAPTSLVPANRQTLSEHRLYLALAPLFLLGIGALVQRIARLPAPRQRTALRAAGTGAVALALVWGALTWRRNEVYQSSLALWTDTAAKRPQNPHAHSNLGIALAAEGRTAEARARFEEAVRLEPRMASFRNNLGSALRSIGQPAAAVEQYRAAVELLPSFGGAWANLGRALTETDRPAEAIPAFQQALGLRPGDWDVRLGLSFALLQTGRLDEAVRELIPLVAEQPDHLGVRGNLAFALTQLGRFPEAIVQYEALLRLQPGDANLLNAFGIALAQAGRLPEARARFAEAVRLDPSVPGARANLERADALLRR